MASYLHLAPLSLTCGWRFQAGSLIARGLEHQEEEMRSPVSQCEDKKCSVHDTEVAGPVFLF